MLPITDLITAWTPGCDADEVEIFREAAHELGGILVVKCVNQLQVKFVVQFNKRRSRLARVSGLVVLMLEQQRAHVHRPTGDPPGESTDGESEVPAGSEFQRYHGCP